MNHLSLRLAWHNDGWNGHICKDPERNIYCVGQRSYPGEKIREERNIDWEKSVCGKSCAKIDGIPPCCNSINAFGTEAIRATADPPDFFNDDTKTIEYILQPSTACIWPYEEMYGDDVRLPEGSGQTFDYNKRLENAKKFFNSLTIGHSLVFYYVNKSNPISGSENQVYVLTGISRVKATGQIMYYENVSEQNKKKYANGFVWQMPITSNYPDEGFRIPLQKYMENDEILRRIAYIPENANNFKYAAKHISDDDALVYVERLLDLVDILIEQKDDTENWTERKIWLQSLLNELWNNRGAYPGLPSVLDYLEAGELLQFHYQEARDGREKKSAEAILRYLTDRNQKKIDGCPLEPDKLEAIRKNWFIKNNISKYPENGDLIENILVRTALTTDQIKNIMSDKRTENGIYSSIKKIIDNPYILSEEYIGSDESDTIPFAKIDHAVLSSPELGLENLYQKNDWKRLRALLVEELKNETVHSFVNLNHVLDCINHRLARYSDWKKEIFNESYIEYDRDHFDEVLVIRIHEETDIKYVYLKEVWDDERAIEKAIKELLGRSAISLSKPFDSKRWKNELYMEDSNLAKNMPKEYAEAIQGQIETCNKIFTCPLSIIAGSAGTGKTTIIKALIKAIQFSSGNTESFCVLAPTGKATDRLREKTDKEAFTIHSFLTRNGWLNPNFSMKRYGGKKETGFSTIIIDESSMIDLHLLAAMFRAIDWNQVTRLVFVGDPNQLPPIGRGKAFSEIIKYVNEINSQAYGKIQNNIRQLENKVNGKGTGIIDLASLYIQDHEKEREREYKAAAEIFLKNIQESDENIDTDLKIICWKNAEELLDRLTEEIKKDMEIEDDKDKMLYQVISPYRNELFGTENINVRIQNALNSYGLKRGTISGISVYDKVIQFTNRSGRKAYQCYNFKEKGYGKVDVFNGEMGLVWTDLRDKDKFKWSGFVIQRFNVQFERKLDAVISFSRFSSEVENNLELAYAISVHKSQGSEFDRLYFVLPKEKQALLSTELLYTGITRAQKHLTLFVEGDFCTLLQMRRPEKSRLASINSSIFTFKPLPEELLNIRHWHEDKKIHRTLAEYMVRSKSELVIANLLFDHGLDNVEYEEPLFAPDGTFFLPDFTIRYRGKTYYWEHWGYKNSEYVKHRKEKEIWFNKFFPEQLVYTEESGYLSNDALELIKKIKEGKTT